MEEMSKIDQELGFDENFQFNEEEPMEEIMEQPIDLKFGLEDEEIDIEELKEEEENPIQQELTRIKRREKLEMGREIEELKRQIDDKDLKVRVNRFTP